MNHHPIRRSIERIKKKKLNLKTNEAIYERIRVLQIKLVKLSFRSKTKDEMKRIVSELHELRQRLKVNDKAA